MEDVRIEEGPLHGRFWRRRCRTESNVYAETGATGTSQESGETGAAKETAKWTFDAGRIAWTSPKHPSCHAYIPESVGSELPANAGRPKQRELYVWQQWIIVNLDNTKPHDADRKLLFV